MTNEEWSRLKEKYRGSDTVCITDEGTIDFSPQSFIETELNGSRLSYDEYLDIMRSSGNGVRKYLEQFFYSGIRYADCRARIERTDRDKGRILFLSIFISGTRGDGSIIDGKEDHVWIDKKGFEAFDENDCVSFTAEIYRYIKLGSGKRLDYSLRDPENIKRTDPYELPTDEALEKQAFRDLLCEVCPYSEQCFGEPCLAGDRWNDLFG